MQVAFFGSSLTSAFWNGAATYYRGIIRALHQRGYRFTFYEPDAYNRQEHRDIPDPDWARIVVYPGDRESALWPVLEEAGKADIVVKASGVGVFDELLEAAIPQMASHRTMTIFWDVDAPATLDRLARNPSDSFHAWVSKYDMILTYGGGQPVVRAYQRAGARGCVPIYNALDPETHYPVRPDPRFASDLAFLGNRLPDREARVLEFFFGPAETAPDFRFVLGGSGWEGEKLPLNMRSVGHVFTSDHNAFNCTPRAVLNISRESMARYGHSPATRVFEAAGAGACVITDAWDGIDAFLEPGREILVASNGAEVAEMLRALDGTAARRIGNAARRRVLAEHTYARRADKFESAVVGKRPQAGVL